MEVRLIPFELDIKLEDQHSKNDFMEYLKHAGLEFNVVRKERVLFLDDMNDDYFVGFLVSRQDFATHCQFDIQQGVPKITEAQIRKGVDYNFFILNKQTFKGVFLTYHLAASLGTLGKFMQKCLGSWLEFKGIRLSPKVWQNNNLLCRYIFSDETIDSILDKFTKFNSVDFSEIRNNCGIFRPNYMKTAKSSVAFDQERIQSIDIVKRDIKDLLDNDDVSNVAVHGEDNANKLDVNFDRILKPWKIYDFDVITRHVIGMDFQRLPANTISVNMLGVITGSPRNQIIIEGPEQR